MQFPYEQYQTLQEAQTVYYPAGEENFARWVFQTVDRAGTRLSQLFIRPLPEFDLLVVEPDDWPLVPHGEMEETQSPHPYWTDVTEPPTLVVPTEIDPIFGTVTPEKFSFMLYHELALAFLEDDPRPWPEETPLWADEWQFKFVALWLSQQLDGVPGIVNTDLRQQYDDIFEPEPDGKTPATVRGFDWYEDTAAEDYLCYELLLEQFAADLLTRFDVSLLPRFLEKYRTEEHQQLLSDEVTLMLAAVLGPEGETWLEELVYF
jgi:hypothetical protein